MRVRKHLSASGLFRLVRQGFAKIKDHRAENVTVSLQDALTSAFAMFSLKDPSLLAFDERSKTDGNLKRVYGLEQVPSDTQRRTILDDVDPETVRPSFKDVFRQAQRGKVLEKMVSLACLRHRTNGRLDLTNRVKWAINLLGQTREQANQRRGSQTGKPFTLSVQTRCVWFDPTGRNWGLFGPTAASAWWNRSVSTAHLVESRVRCILNRVEGRAAESLSTRFFGEASRRF